MSEAQAAVRQTVAADHTLQGSPATDLPPLELDEEGKGEEDKRDMRAKGALRAPSRTNEGFAVETGRDETCQGGMRHA